MELGKQIKKYRTELSLSQEGLAQAIYVSRQTISNWENNKNYPDVKSLLLLSSQFDVSLDILIKGDVDEMKKIIEQKDIEVFKKKSRIFSILFAMVVILPVPLFSYLDHIGVIIWGLVSLSAIIYAYGIEKLKKAHNIQTYKEITAFYDGTTLEDKQQHMEEAKRPYQKVLLALGSGLLTLVVGAIINFIMNI